MTNADDNGTNGNSGSSQNFGGLLDGMANLIGKLGDLAEKGKEIRESGEFPKQGNDSIKGSYGFAVKFGPGGQRNDEVRVSPLEKAVQSDTHAAPARPESREPHVDVFLECDHILVVAEMPGISVENIGLDFAESHMTLSGRSDRVKFEKRVDLGRSFTPDNVETSVNNGVVEIRLRTEPESPSEAED